MAQMGMLVEEWPWTLGCEGCGIVVQLGEGAEKHGFMVGDYVFGCTRLGYKGYGQGQEYLLKDAAVSLKKPDHMTPAQAATVGVAAQTAGLGVWEGLKVPLPDGSKVPQKEEWVVVFGGAASVGKAAIQLLIAAGFKVVATCSSKSKQDVEKLGAVTVDYKQPEADQVEEIWRLTGGNFYRIFDATSVDDPKVAKELFKKVQGDKLFVTTNDWSGITDFEGGKTYNIELGPIGRPGATGLNAVLQKHGTAISKLLDNGQLVAQGYEIAGEGFDAAIKAYEYHAAGKAGSKKVLVELQKE